MGRNRYLDGYLGDEETYVYDQCCQNCRYYCDWDAEEYNGCHLYSREDYQKHPPTGWCCDWKGKRDRYGYAGG